MIRTHQHRIVARRSCYSRWCRYNAAYRWNSDADVIIVMSAHDGPLNLAEYARWNYLLTGILPDLRVSRTVSTLIPGKTAVRDQKSKVKPSTQTRGFSES